MITTILAIITIIYDLIIAFFGIVLGVKSGRIDVRVGYGIQITFMVLNILLVSKIF